SGVGAASTGSGAGESPGSAPPPSELGRGSRALGRSLGGGRSARRGHAADRGDSAARPGSPDLRQVIKGVPSGPRSGPAAGAAGLSRDRRGLAVSSRRMNRTVAYGWGLLLLFAAAAFGALPEERFPPKGSWNNSVHRFFPDLDARANAVRYGRWRAVE